MKKITFKVSSQKEGSVVSVIKEVNKISCRICFDFENGCVAVEDVSDAMIDIVIELINNYYTILGVDIDNTFEEPEEKHDVPVVAKTVEESTEPETVEVVTEKQPTVLEPQSEDDLIIKKVEFENQYVENLINNLLKTAYWALYNKCATEKDIGEYILTCISEISMRYSSKPIIEFSIGDIIDVNYGSHLPGEIMGGHVHAIVCDILNEDMAYVVPITKVRSDISAVSYLFMSAPQDAIYEDELYKGGTVLLDKGKYVRVERFRCVKGKTKPEFFEKLLYQLASTFDFTGCLITAVEDDRNLDLTIGENTDEVVETFVATDDADDEVAMNKLSDKNVGEIETTLLETIGFALEKLDASKKVEEQVESFLNDIGMTTTERMVTQSFIIACDVKKISYGNIILRLYEQFPKVREEVIKDILKKEFKNWLEKYPNLVEKHPKISIIAILKVFAKKFA